MENSFPNTFIIGVQKAGTTSLHNWIQQHPEVFSSNSLKDNNVFAADKSIEEFREFFKKFDAKKKGSKRFLHSNVNYLFYEKALRNLSKIYSDDVKFIVLLRDPTERVISAYRFFYKLGKENRSPKDALIYNPKTINHISVYNDNLTYLEHSMYFHQLVVFENYFPRKSLMLIDYYELSVKPEEVIKSVYSFLNINPSYSPELKLLNKTGTSRFSFLQGFLYGKNRLRTTFVKLINPLISIERRKVIKDLIRELNTNKNQNNVRINEATENQIYKLLEDDLKKFDEKYKLPFSKTWIRRVE